MGVFLSTLNQTAFLFAFIVAGFILGKFKFVPDNAQKVLSKFENNLFVPALVMGTFIKNFTVKQISSAWKLMLVGFVIVFIMMPIAIGLSKLFYKDKYTQNIATYGLVFSNFGFMGNAVVSALFPEIFLEYIIFTMSLWTMIYLWGVPTLLIYDAEGGKRLRDRLKSFVNPMFIAMLIGMVIGLVGLPLPEFVMKFITVSGDCMSPIAMLLTGVTVSAINLKKTFTDWKVYCISLIRLVAIPLVFIGISLFVPIPDIFFRCILCSLAMPLGLSTIVVPGGYGKDTTVAAGMAVISHLLSCITIPLIFMLI